MPLSSFQLRVPMGIQVGIVATLFVAAIGAMLTTGASIAEREGRRASARGLLDQAGRILQARGAAILARAPQWHNGLDLKDWDALDRALTAVATESLTAFDGVEGGYYLNDIHRFLGSAFPTERVVQPPSARAVQPDAAGPDPGDPHRSPAAGGSAPRRRLGPPPLEYELIESLVMAAIRTGGIQFVIQDVPPSTVAIRAAPVQFGGRVAGATWTMTRLVDPLFLDRSARGFRLTAALALLGCALALVLTLGLVRTVRRQDLERDRLQTELRRSERLAALGKLLAGVAHEVRNPLAGIRSTAQLWQRGVVGLDAESLGGLVHEVDRLEEIVARLLQFSRADAQELAPGDLNAVVSEAARLASGPAAAQGIRVEVELATQLPPVAMAPPALLQVFRNLTTNAVQAMAPGGTLRLSTRRDPSRGAILASVADTGPGLAPEALKHLFEPFFTTKAEGTGLGLAIAREITLAHRGDLRAANRPEGTGAVFTLTLPAAPNPNPGGPP
jgi:two-component system, NtrC family, sensor histidine kinase HydH